MSKTKSRSASGRSTLTALRAALRRRIRGFYRRCNAEDWEGCYRYLDPRLREGRRVEQGLYQESLRAFMDHYGAIQVWYTRISLHDGAKNSQDTRPFAYAYVVWLDARKRFHVFRERWVYESGRWYTRVVGLVVHLGDGADA